MNDALIKHSGHVIAFAPEVNEEDQDWRESDPGLTEEGFRENWGERGGAEVEGVPREEEESEDLAHIVNGGVNFWGCSKSFIRFWDLKIWILDLLVGIDFIVLFRLV